MNMPLAMPDRQRVARRFGEAASGYDDEALAQRESALRLLEGAAFAGLVLDIGCGTGWMSRRIAETSLQSQVLALDISESMLASPALAHPRITLVCADAAALPLAADSIDHIVSNFALQWLPSPEEFAAGLARVLRQGGGFRLAMPVDGSLRELKQAWRQVEDIVPLNAFHSAERWAEALQTAGLHMEIRPQPVSLLQYYPSVRHMLRGLKAIGASETPYARRTGLWGRGKLRALEAAMEPFRTAAGLPLRYDVLKITGTKP
ncbi:MAG TPA: methyltransferase domain-containing protein [Fluviicoccus sp.]|nr:methyltransferase domain-containing protein [Fluviicoccus sp.]